MAILDKIHIRHCPCGDPICKQVFLDPGGSDGRFDPEQGAEIVRRYNVHADLLAALKGIQKSLQAAIAKPRSQDALIHMRVAEAGARAAIAKAEGR